MNQTGTTDARARGRRRLMLLGLLLLLPALALVGKVGAMYWFDHHGRGEYADAQYSDARSAFGVNGVLNVLQTWVASYDEGEARYQLGDFDGAVGDFETALTTVPTAQECRVRIDLALAHEAVGDDAQAGGDVAGSRSAWTAGREALADGRCLGAGASSAAQRANAGDVDGSLAAKLSAAPSASPSPSPSGPGSEPDSPGTAATGALRSRNQRGQDLHARGEQRAQDQQDGTDAPGPTSAPSGTAYSW